MRHLKENILQFFISLELFSHYVSLGVHSLDNRIYLINLYDYYKELLTDKQKEYFEGYYFDNMSLQELSEEYDVSRNAIHKQVKETEEKLLDYEKKLRLYGKRLEILKIIEPLQENMKEKIEEFI